MAIKKVCETGEFWGAKYKSCNYEFEPEDREIFEYLKKEIENGMDYIPDEIEYNTYNCLNDAEIKELEEMIKNLYEEGE